MSLNVYVKREIKNCKTASILDYVDDDPEIESPTLVTTIKAGKTISVNLDEIAWSWDDKKYYKCKIGRREGYILAALVE